MENLFKSLYKGFASSVKRLDRLTHYRIGDFIRGLTNVNTRPYWERYFTRYKDFYRDFPYENIADFLPKDRQFSLLDLGCALGDGCMLLKKRFPKADIHGADFSAISIDKAKAKSPNIDFFLLDILKSSPPRSFDFIVLSHILEHMNDPLAVVDKCLPFAKEAIFISTPYTKDFESARLYWPGEHRYLFNEHTFEKYNCEVLRITPLMESGYHNIIYKIIPRTSYKKTPLALSPLRRALRQAFLAAGYYLGVFELVRVMLLKAGYFPILVYHKVLESRANQGRDSSFYILGIGITKDHFQEQLEYIKKRYKVISLKDYLDKRKKGENICGSLVVTFDDGYKDSSQAMLKIYGMPATIFIMGNSFKKVYWKHWMYILLDAAAVVDFYVDIEPYGRLNFSLDTPKKKKEAILFLSQALERFSLEKREEMLNVLKKTLGVREEINPGDIYLDEESIRGLLKDGFSFGSHSMTHRSLTILSRQDLFKEIKESHDLLADVTGEKEIPFSVPFGHYNADVVEGIKENKFSCNLTSDEGLNKKDEDIFHLKRSYIQSRSLPEFVYIVSGTQMLFRGFLEAVLCVFRKRGSSDDLKKFNNQLY